MRVLLVVAFVFVLTLGSFAQKGAVLTGKVTSCGTPAKTTTVELFEVGVGRKAAIETNENGIYRFENVPPGKYFFQFGDTKYGPRHVLFDKDPILLSEGEIKEQNIEDPLSCQTEEFPALPDIPQVYISAGAAQPIDEVSKTVNVIDGQESAYDQPTDNAQTVGLYDFGSIMHYYPYAFSRNRKLTMESKPAGIEFGVGSTYSAGDIDTIKRIYGAAPKTVTIASVPSGAMVTVDGVATKTPKAFTWAMNSTHTLAVPAGAQAVGGQAYIYGRWSDVTTASHSITVKPGGGTPATPKSSPAVTVYTASFIHLAPFQPQVSIVGAGTVTAVPAAKAYPGVSGTYYPVRLPVTYTAHPASGYIFAGWFQPTPSGLNPVAGTSSDFVFAYVQPTGTALTTIKTNPAGVEFLVDGSPSLGPSLFAWQPGSSHTVSTSDPYGSPNTRSLLVNWSDKGAATHSVMATSTSRTLTATVKLQYKPYLTTDPQCAGTLKYAPASGDGFYNSGTALQVTPTPAAGWVFAGWTQDMAQMANPAKFTLTGEIRGAALFNTVAAPLKITSFSPASLVVGSGVRTLAVIGTGFTKASHVQVNGVPRTTSYVGPTRLTVPLVPADVAASNALDVAVFNSGPDPSCFVYDGRVLFITEA